MGCLSCRITPYGNWLTSVVIGFPAHNQNIGIRIKNGLFYILFTVKNIIILSCTQLNYHFH